MAIQLYSIKVAGDDTPRCVMINGTAYAPVFWDTSPLKAPPTSCLFYLEYDENTARPNANDARKMSKLTHGLEDLNQEDNYVGINTRIYRLAGIPKKKLYVTVISVRTPKHIKTLYQTVTFNTLMSESYQLKPTRPSRRPSIAQLQQAMEKPYFIANRYVLDDNTKCFYIETTDKTWQREPHISKSILENKGSTMIAEYTRMKREETVARNPSLNAVNPFNHLIYVSSDPFTNPYNDIEYEKINALYDRATVRNTYGA